MHVSLPPRLLEILVCPLCKATLRWERDQGELICQADRLAYPVVDGVPHLLVEEARTLASAPSTPLSPDGLGSDGPAG